MKVMTMRLMMLMLLGLMCLAGCDGGDESGTAAAAPAAESKQSATAATAAVAVDPMMRLAHKGLYSQMDPMVALRSWENVSGGAQPSGPVALTDLPAGEGREVTFGLCGACHSMQLVVQQRLPAHRWDELWTWMIQTQGMPDPGPEIQKQILTYLKQHFSS